MSAAPRMLAGFVQSALETIDDIDPALGQAVRERLKHETLATIESASPVALISVDYDIELTECFFAVAGAEYAQTALRDNLRQCFDKPWVRVVLDGVRALFGRSLMRAATWAPQLWNLVYRDAGEMSVLDRTNGRVCFELCRLPLAIAASPHYLEGMAASFAGLFDVAGPGGRVVLEGPDLRTGRATFTLSW